MVDPLTQIAPPSASVPATPLEPWLPTGLISEKRRVAHSDGGRRLATAPPPVSANDPPPAPATTSLPEKRLSAIDETGLGPLKLPRRHIDRAAVGEQDAQRARAALCHVVQKRVRYSLREYLGDREHSAAARRYRPGSSCCCRPWPGCR